MRVVLDTNVLVSGIFFNGPPFEILRAWRRGHVQLAVTPDIVREYEAVLARLQARFIISGDKHLLSITEYEGVPTVRPRTFIDAAVGELGPDN